MPIIDIGKRRQFHDNVAAETRYNNADNSNNNNNNIILAICTV